jgi:hypothetical protein
MVAVLSVEAVEQVNDDCHSDSGNDQGKINIHVMQKRLDGGGKLGEGSGKRLEQSQQQREGQTKIDKETRQNDSGNGPHCCGQPDCEAGQRSVLFLRLRGYPFCKIL